jgi:hypothetical protein
MNRYLTELAGMQTGKLRGKSRKERAKFLVEGPGRRCLALSSMVLFLDGKGAIKHVGVVVRRDRLDLSAEWEYLTVGVQLVDDSLGQFLKAFPPEYGGQDSQLNRRNRQRIEEEEEDAMGGTGNGPNVFLRHPPVAAQMFQVFIFTHVDSNSMTELTVTYIAAHCGTLLYCTVLYCTAPCCICRHHCPTTLLALPSTACADTPTLPRTNPPLPSTTSRPL